MVSIIMIVGYILSLFYALSNLIIALTIFRVGKLDMHIEDVRSYWAEDESIQLFGFGVGYFEETVDNLLLNKQLAKVVIYFIIFIVVYFILVSFAIAEMQKNLLLDQFRAVYINIIRLM